MIIQLLPEYNGNAGSTIDDGYVGVIVGRLNQEDIFNYSSAAITNCHVINPTVSGGENVGGIVGRSYGRNDAIKGCTVSGGTIEGLEEQSKERCLLVVLLEIRKVL